MQAGWGLPAGAARHPLHRAPAGRRPRGVELVQMRLMLAVWTIVVLGGLAYFIVIGLSHH
jgi:hypothetical protein